MPESGVISPAMIRIRVDFPEPFAPDPGRRRSPGINLKVDVVEHRRAAKMRAKDR